MQEKNYLEDREEKRVKSEEECLSTISKGTKYEEVDDSRKQAPKDGLSHENKTKKKGKEPNDGGTTEKETNPSYLIPMVKKKVTTYIKE